MKLENEISNFRDVAQYYPTLQKGQLLRSACLALCEDQTAIQNFLTNNQVRTIIDLRAEREIAQNPYPQRFIRHINYLSVPFDPWQQSPEFRNKHHNGTNAEIAYHFFIKECKTSMKKLILSLLEAQTPILIHCHWGKDRTGIVIALIGLLLEVPRKVILADYLVSQMDTNPRLLQILFDEITQAGSVLEYFQSCELTLDNLRTLKNKLCKS